MKRLAIAVLLVAGPLHPENRPPVKHVVSTAKRHSKKRTVSALLSAKQFDDHHSMDEDDEYSSVEDMTERMY